MRPSLLALAALLLAGCLGARFSNVHSGTYLCASTVTLNTCGVPVAGTTSMTVTLEGGGSDLVSLLAPSDGALVSPSVGWSSIQFGAQADPLVYELDGTAGCAGSGHYAFHGRDELTTVGTDHLVMNVRYDYEHVLSCGVTGVDTCSLAYELDCTKTP